MTDTARSNLAEVRNPILALPAAKRLADLDPAAREALCAILDELRAESREKAEQCWVKHKAPMAAYWKAAGVYCGHIAKAARRLARENDARRQPELRLLEMDEAA